MGHPCSVQGMIFCGVLRALFSPTDGFSFFLLSSRL